MLRIALYIAIIIACSGGLALSMHFRKSPSILGLVPPLVVTFCYGLLMAGYTVYHWSNGLLWHDPPPNLILAAIANGVILLWSLVAAYLIVDRRVNG